MLKVKYAGGGGEQQNANINMKLPSAVMILKTYGQQTTTEVSFVLQALFRVIRSMHIAGNKPLS